jgi:dihydroorotate dehydrogenase electron transfer subunit
MSKFIEQGPIVVHEHVGPQIWRMVIELPKTAKEAIPGQFIHVSMMDGLHILRRPISIAGTDPQKGLVEILYRVVGEGTELMTHWEVGKTVNSVGPLGNGFTMSGKGHIVGIGGGVGIAPILFMARKAETGQMTAIIGGRNKEEVFWKDYFPKTLRRLIVTTDDGSFGIKGFSVSVLPDLLAKEKTDEVAVCGPAVMMRAAAQMAKDADVYCEVSMERRMGCGIGTCLGCVCDRKDHKGHYKVCSDGPVFNAEEIVL